MFLKQFYYPLIFSIIISGMATFILLFFVNAPYGKFLKTGWGTTIKAKYAWLIMEFPAFFLPLYLFFRGGNFSIILITFLFFWEIHYVYRTFIYPFNIRSKNKDFPLILVFFALIFNTMNGLTNGYALFSKNAYLDYQWFFDIRFITGVILFIVGFIINKNSDYILKHLRNKNDNSYKIPNGGLFIVISCPHYLGEIIEWTGWAIMSWNLAGTAFAFFTFCNLFPRAIAQHKWYKQTFPNYPKNRKAIFPFII